MTRQDERGAGSVLVLVAVMVLMTALLAATVLVSGHLARRQAAAAADLAALAAARNVATGNVELACDTAASVAAANDAKLRDCVVQGAVVEIQVEVPVQALRDWLPAQLRRARAGPVESQ